MLNNILHGTALEKLKELQSESVDCCITSPPYWSLRDYKTEGQLGLESTFQEYITKLIEIFDQVKRVLKKTGSCWVNMGDTYSGSGTRGGQGYEDSKDITERRYYNSTGQIPEKSLCLIPQRFQIAMVDEGWICRNTIIWYKPNCMPSSALDRFTVNFEYFFFFTKSQKYYFETQYESMDKYPVGEKMPAIGGNKAPGYENPVYSGNRPYASPLGRIKRCVWKIPTAQFSQAHFAVFPPALVKTPLLACCPVNGLVLDPFLGSGTVGLVAMQNARNFLGIELSQEYIDMAMQRLDPYLKQERLQFA